LDVLLPVRANRKRERYAGLGIDGIYRGSKAYVYFTLRVILTAKTATPALVGGARENAKKRFGIFAVLVLFAVIKN
jgi:hypothetical protein